MALSTAVFVGETKNWIPELVERARQLKVSAGKFRFRFINCSQGCIRTLAYEFCAMLIYTDYCTLLQCIIQEVNLVLI